MTVPVEQQRQLQHLSRRRRIGGGAAARGALLRLRLEGGGKCAEVDLVVEGRLAYLKP